MMVKFIDILIDRYERFKIKKLTEGDAISFRSAFWFMTIIFSIVIILLIYSALLAILNVGNKYGYVLATIPLIILFLEKPAEYLLTSVKIGLKVKKYYLKFTWGDLIKTSLGVYAIEIGTIILMGIIFYIILWIGVLFSPQVMPTLTTNQQGIVFLIILFVWVLEKASEKLFDNALNNFVKSIDNTIAVSPLISN